MTETGHREPTPEVKELARRWLVLSRMKKIPLAPAGVVFVEIWRLAWGGC